MDNESSPKLGIFWIIEDQIVAYTMPLARAEHAAGYANYPHGHADLWPMVVRSHPRLRGVGYEHVPRGRVTYEIDSGTYRLLVPPAVARDAATVARLIRHFRLPLGQTRVMADAHYDPPNDAEITP